jgi:hypothetical protein
MPKGSQSRATQVQLPLAILTCHFKQPGLKLGFPAAASSFLVKTYSVGILVDLGARCGSSFGGYTKTGTKSNSVLIGAGTANRSRTLFVCLEKDVCGTAVSPSPSPSLFSAGLVGGIVLKFEVVTGDKFPSNIESYPHPGRRDLSPRSGCTREPKSANADT